MNDSEKILATLEEIKTALRALYGDAKNQDGIISTIGRTISHDLENELGKISSSLDKLDKLILSVANIQAKVQNVDRLSDTVNKLTTMIAKIDLSTLEENMDYIRTTLVSFDGKLTSITRRLP